MALYYLYTSMLQKSPSSPSFLIIIVTRINYNFGDGNGDDEGNDENNKDEDNEDFYCLANIY